MQKSGANTWGRRGGLIAMTISTMIAAGCGGGGGGGSNASGQTGSTPGANTPPTISAQPASEASVGSVYAVTPAAQDADGDTLAFSVANKPAWAAFNTATGQLTGTPGADDIGAHSDVVISVSDGATSASLAAFSIMVAQSGAPGGSTNRDVPLVWEVPTRTLDGQTLTDLTGYRLHYGKTASELNEVVEIESPGVNIYDVKDLPAGTYYFAVRAITASGLQSALSNVVSREVS
ncbi:MAG: putative Ig domain-containing protein [Steroidobacter sp.]